MSPIGRRAPVSGCNKGANSHIKKKEYTTESLVRAVQEGRAHLIKTAFGYQIHIGDRSTLRHGGVAIQMNNVGVSGNVGLINANDDAIIVGDIEIPTNLDKLTEAFTLIQEAEAKREQEIHPLPVVASSPPVAGSQKRNADASDDLSGLEVKKLRGEGPAS